MSDRGRMVLFVVGMLVLFTTVSLLVSATTAFDYNRDHASSRTNPWGTKAWRELIERSGVGAQDWLAPLTTLSDEVEFLVLLDPTEPIEDDERTALRDWVRAGGRLVLASYADRSDASVAGRWARASMDQTLRQFGVTLATATRADVTVSPSLETEATADLSAVHLPSTGRLRVLGEGEIEPAEPKPVVAVLLADEDGAPAAVSVSYGHGAVVVLAEAEMLSNATLSRADNVVLAANVVYAGGAPGVVHFDEYHHGFGGSGGALAGPRVDTSPFRNTALALLGVVAIYAIGRSRRFGAPVSRAGTDRRSSAEYVRALAQVYSQAEAGHAAAAMLASSFRRRIAAAAALPASAELPVLAGELQRRGLPGREMTELLRQLEAADEEIADARLLTLAQQVARYERMLVR